MHCNMDAGSYMAACEQMSPKSSVFSGHCRSNSRGRDDREI